MPTSQDEITRGFIPYHQVTLDEFAINDRVHLGLGFWMKTFIHPFWVAQFRFSRSGTYAYVAEWSVFSGLDRNESSRKSWYHDFKSDLPYVQALLDINEIHARRLAALSPGELPRGEGTSQEATRANLQNKMKLLCQREYELMQAEMDDFAKATSKGSNRNKVRELGTEVKKRLAAVVPTHLPGGATAVPTPMATPSASSAVAPSVAPRPK